VTKQNRFAGPWTVQRVKEGVARRLVPPPPPNQLQPLPPGQRPAALAEWVNRGPYTSRWFGFPLAWTMRDDARFEHPSRVAVVVHCFYADLFEEILTFVRNIPVPFDLIVTNASGESIDPLAVDQPNLANHVVLPIENHGRDIYPLMALVNADLLNPYDVVLKVHTKRSTWRSSHDLAGDGDTWRRELLTGLLGDGDRMRDVLTAFASDPTLGIVTAPGSVLGPEYWGDNQEITRTLLRRLELDLDEPGLVFAAGSMYWTRAFLLNGLRALGMSRDDFPDEAGQVNQTTAHGMERLLGAVTTEAGLSIRASTEIAPRSSEAWEVFTHDRPLDPPVDVVPFYLPQFHDVPENSQWWGPGFTEWTNVAAGRPAYLGHHQPKLPRDLGFYDLHSPWVMPRQEDLARQYGISAFMFYHYWFAGQPILADPIRSRLERTGGLPFCIMWANENWTRRWDGGDKDMLMHQDYSRVPATEFIDSILDLLAHPEYFRLAGRPVLSVYRPAQIPQVGDVVAHWRSAVRDAGIGELLMVAVDMEASFDGLPGTPQDHGFDALMSFPPHNLEWTWRPHEGLGVRPGYLGNIFEYRKLAERSMAQLPQRQGEQLFPGVMVGFDNTARRPDASDLWYGANPYTFRRWLAATLRSVMAKPRSERIVFINAWNEWAEGTVLEPTDKYGLTCLQAVRDSLLTMEHGPDADGA
jgi:lipopolysaccharide biosynthesis protein